MISKELSCLLSAKCNDFHYSADRHIFLVTQAKRIVKASKKGNKETSVFSKSARKAYESAAASILSKMPLMNRLLKALFALDPTIRGVTLILNELLKLPELVTNILLTEEEKEEYEVRLENI